MSLYPSSTRTRVREVEAGRFEFSPISRIYRAVEIAVISGGGVLVTLAFAGWLASLAYRDLPAGLSFPQTSDELASWACIVTMLVLVGCAIYLAVQSVRGFFQPYPSAILPVDTLRRGEAVPVEWRLEGPKVEQAREAEVSVACTETTVTRGEWEFGRDLDGDGDAERPGGFKYYTDSRILHRETLQKRKLRPPVAEVSGRALLVIPRGTPATAERPWYRKTGTYTRWELVISAKLDDDVRAGQSLRIPVEDGPARPEFRAESETHAKPPVEATKPQKSSTMSRRFGASATERPARRKRPRY